jgi:hypothetical protein
MSVDYNYENFVQLPLVTVDIARWFKYLFIILLFLVLLIITNKLVNFLQKKLKHFMKIYNE